MPDRSAGTLDSASHCLIGNSPVRSERVSPRRNALRRRRKTAGCVPIRQRQHRTVDPAIGGHDGCAIIGSLVPGFAIFYFCCAYDRSIGGKSERPEGLSTDAIVQGITHMATGTVKWFNSTKGFGFIQPDNGGQDVFVHISAVERAGLSTLADGQKINYEIEQDRRTGKSSAGNLSKAG